MDFEDKIKRIKEIINRLNSTEISLKDGIELYKEGITEINNAQKMLEEAKLVYDEIKLESEKEKE
ncbi:exodeoxyribonuclease VII small subunit [Helicobacter sp. MIT 14-3879]|uniref:exodeoxyribonuclease VII small subunit n=1 Tax=Helicobacter sp. MIT 14-3879 TaxID=2040649 RepID=UPI000E1EF5CD|nr:exodeoxyribonuclease VII small subunit [Helicobacter sp. MIT 14-3879]RDU65632.1 exodeoxyribonuclease VII small subunit [Helicobacter sp. MIT 14-3879]